MNHREEIKIQEGDLQLDNKKLELTMGLNHKLLEMILVRRNINH